ncbi:hypothetical protein TCEA9_04850 [Thermobrachium celere]|nr:hypothetical protein TCEA9_04850 [Thermobrachium celere]
MVSRVLKRIYAALIYIFLYAPILILIIFSFNESKSRGSFTGFTLKWYKQLFSDRQIMQAMYYTLTVAFIASLVSTILGTLAAIGIHNMKKNN